MRHSNSVMHVFARLFVDDSEKEQERQAQMIHAGRSVMDVIGAEAKFVRWELSSGDRDKLDGWFTSVRELESCLQANESWINKPKPKVRADFDVDRKNSITVERATLEIVWFATRTDSTRFVTLHMPGNAQVRGLEGVDEGFHGLSHHGRDEEKLDQLAIVEQAVINEWADFLRNLKTMQEGDRTPLDKIMVILTSNLGNASSHNSKNMPVLLPEEDSSTAATSPSTSATTTRSRTSISMPSISWACK